MNCVHLFPLGDVSSLYIASLLSTQQWRLLAALAPNVSHIHIMDAGDPHYMTPFFDVLGLQVTEGDVPGADRPSLRYPSLRVLTLGPLGFDSEHIQWLLRELLDC